MLPDRQVVSLLDQVIEQARSLYPDRRRGILRMGANSARALNYALSVTWNYQINDAVAFGCQCDDDTVVRQAHCRPCQAETQIQMI